MKGGDTAWKNNLNGPLPENGGLSSGKKRERKNGVKIIQKRLDILLKTLYNESVDDFK